MFCPKCKNPLFDESHCNFCGWTKEEPKPNEEKQPENEKKDFPKSYYRDSWLLFVLVLIAGLIRVYVAVTNGNDSLYKGIINCLAAFIFIPQIKVETNSVVVIFLVKIIAAAGLIIVI